MKGPWREIHSDGTAHFMNPAFQRIERLHEQRWEFIHGHLVLHDAPPRKLHVARFPQRVTALCSPPPRLEPPQGETCILSEKPRGLRLIRFGGCGGLRKWKFLGREEWQGLELRIFIICFLDHFQPMGGLSLFTLSLAIGKSR